MIFTTHRDRIWRSSQIGGYFGLLNLTRPSGVVVVNQHLCLDLLSGHVELPRTIRDCLAPFNIPSSSVPPPQPSPSANDGMACWIHVTNACNLACDYCYIHKTPQRMTEEVADLVIASLESSAHDHGIQRLRLTYAGGEPSLNVPVMRRIAAGTCRIQGLKARYSVTTNATHAHDDFVEFLKEYSCRVLVSLDGLGEFNAARHSHEGRGSFAAVEEGLEKLVGALGSRRLTVNIVVSPQNVLGLEEITRYLLERRIQFKYSFCRPRPVARADSPTSEVELSTRPDDWPGFTVRLLRILRDCLSLVRAQSYSGFYPEIVLDKFSVRGNGATKSCAM